MLLRGQNNQRPVALGTREIRDRQREGLWVCGNITLGSLSPGESLDHAGLVRGALEPASREMGPRTGGYGARLVEKGQFSPA